MRKSGPIAKGEPAAELQRLFAPVSPGLVIEASVLDVVPRIDPRVLPALSAALAASDPPLNVSRLYGYMDPEVEDWPQVILVLEHQFEPGTTEWSALIERAAAVADAASESAPEVKGLWTTVGFDF